MMWKWLVLVFCITYVYALPGYRLPGDVIPQTYRLQILSDIEEPNFNFTGNVWIKIQCVRPTNTIILHSKGLEINDEKVKVKEVDTEENEVNQIPITQQRFVPENEFYLMKVEQNLKPGKTYIIFIPFNGIISEGLVGFYRSSYKEKGSNTTKWLGVTQFEAVSARKAFPCFDEPAMKSKFRIVLGHKENFKSISNMPLIKTTPIANMKGWVWNEFEESVPMSTYLVAYVIGDLDYREAPQRDNNVTFRIWARKDAIDQVEFAKKVGPEVLHYFEEYFDVKYPLPKQDMAAIPDFNAGAMENWGLITYREVDLLYDEKTTPLLNKERIAGVISHELAHQWFGNLVTMKWWTDLWLNEGFATYVSTLGIDKVFPEWKIKDMDVVYYKELVFELDSLKTSHPISVEIGNPDEIDQIFDIISYKKGSAIIHMMHKLLGKSFELGVSDYLKEHKYGNAEQDDLWKALTDRAHKDGTLSPELSIKEIMDSWTLQTGYPIIHVIRDYKTGTVEFSQKRYLKVAPEGKEAAVNESCWWVPLTYTTQSERDFNDTSTKIWLRCGQNLKIKDMARPDDWLILNNNLAGIYRTQYDDRNWRLITKTLNSDDYKSISPVNRAGILIDIFDFAWRGDVTYDRAFEVLSYLTRETEHIPLSTGLGKLYDIGRMLKRTPAYGQFSAFVRNLIKPMYQHYSNLLNVPTSLEELRMHILLNKWACGYDMESCKLQVIDIFNKWRSMPDPDKNNPIPTNVRSIVYGTVVKFGDADTWDFLWQRYRNSNSGTEKNQILEALSYSRDIWVLNRFLEWSIDDKSYIRKQDSSHAFGSVAAQSVGHYVACEFLQSRLKDIHKYHSDRSSALGRYLSSCARSIIFNDENEKWKQFVSVNKEELKGAKLAAEQSVETVIANTKWYNKHYKTILKALSSAQ